MIVAQLFAGLAELEFRGYVAAVRASGEAFPEAFTLAAPTPLSRVLWITPCISGLSSFCVLCRQS